MCSFDDGMSFTCSFDDGMILSSNTRLLSCAYLNEVQSNKATKKTTQQPQAAIRGKLASLSASFEDSKMEDVW